MPIKAKYSMKNSISPEDRQAVKSLIWPDVWATGLELEVDAKKFTTIGREYIIPVLRDRSDEIVIKKAAQMGFTVAMIIKTLHNVVERKWHGMYLLPFKQNSRTFVQARVDTMIDSNPLLARHFHRVENVGHKQTNEKVNLYFRGTNIATDLREAPVDFEIWDERDKFVTKWLGDARARMDASAVAKLTQLSTPSAPGIGIDSNDNWKSSDQCRWEVACLHCGRYQVVTLQENIKLGDDQFDSRMECSHCHKRIKDKDRGLMNATGRWVPSFLDGRKRGYHISQFSSPTKKLEKILEQYFLGLEKVEELRNFENLNMGETYAGKGDKFDEGIMDACIASGLHLKTVPVGPIFVGVDVGAVLHCKASYMGRNEKKVMWDYKIFRNFGQLDEFLGSLHNFMCVIDAHPEKHKARELADKYKGKVYLGFEKDSPKQSEMAVFDDKKMEVSIDRTMALDQLIADYTGKKYALPINARDLGEEMPKKNYNGFYAQHFEMVRVPKELPGGIETVRWEKTHNPDHGHHADMFELIAFKKKPRLAISPEIARAFQRVGSYTNA